MPPFTRAESPKVSIVYRSLQHGLQVLSDGERRLGLALNLLHGHALRDLDQGQALGEVDVEDTLRSPTISFRFHLQRTGCSVL